MAADENEEVVYTLSSSSEDEEEAHAPVAQQPPTSQALSVNSGLQQQPPASHLVSVNGIQFSVTELAQKAEIALRDGAGKILAVVMRNADGVFGRHMMASAAARLGVSNLGGRTHNVMAAPGRTTSLTSGAGTLNNNFETLHNAVVDSGDAEVLKLARLVVRAVERREGQAKSLIFVQDDAELEATVRVHAFPPKDPNPPRTAPVGRIKRGQQDHDLNPTREIDPAEGGRMLGHTDQPGTDGVALLNLGSCDFFFDIGIGTDVKKRPPGFKCQAQKAKECWCVGPVGGHGHWVTEADAPLERFYADSPEMPKWLLPDRLCATCACGGQGQSCKQCLEHTVRLRSGDLVIFGGRRAYHGVSAVVPEASASRQLPPSSAAAAVPPLPSWVQSRLDDGWRMSVQWRLTDRATARKLEIRDETNWEKTGPDSSNAAPSAVFYGDGHRLGGATGGGASSSSAFQAVQDTDDPALAAAIADSLASAAAAAAGGSSSSASAHEAAEDDDPALAAAIADSLATAQHEATRRQQQSQYQSAARAPDAAGRIHFKEIKFSKSLAPLRVNQALHYALLNGVKEDVDVDFDEADGEPRPLKGQQRYILANLVAAADFPIRSASDARSLRSIGPEMAAAVERSLTALRAPPPPPPPDPRGPIAQALCEKAKRQGYLSQDEHMILLGLSSALEQQQQRDKTWAPAVPVRVQPFSGTGHRLGGGSSTAVAAPAAEDAHSTDDKEEERKRKREEPPGSGTEGDPIHLD